MPAGRPAQRSGGARPRRPARPGHHPLLRRFLLDFRTVDAAEVAEVAAPMLGIYGVTAFDLEDAVSIVLEELGMDQVRSPRRVDEDVDLSEPEALDLTGALGPSCWRGIWYPFWPFVSDLLQAAPPPDPDRIARYR